MGGWVVVVVVVCVCVWVVGWGSRAVWMCARAVDRHGRAQTAGQVCTTAALEGCRTTSAARDGSDQQGLQLQLLPHLACGRRWCGCAGWKRR